MKKGPVSVLLGMLIMIGAPSVAIGELLPLEQALNVAVSRNFSVQLEAETLRSRAGRVLEAQGVFDPRVSVQAARNRDRLPLRRDEILNNLLLGLGDKARYLTDSASYQVGLSKTLETGHVLAGTLGVSRLDDEQLERSGVPFQTRATGTLTYRMPLFRNAGRATVTADLRAAEAELAATRHRFVAVLESVVRQTAFAYWDLRAKSRGLELAAASEQRIADFLQELKRLIAADELPAAELDLAAANLADRRSARLAAEQALSEARRQLARAMGLAAGDLPAEREATEEFTKIAPSLAEELGEGLALCAQAKATRAELESLRQSLTAATLLRQAASNNLKPQVDLDLTLGYLGRKDSTSLARGLVAFNETGSGGFGGVTISMELPFRNDAARGLLLQRLAAEDSLRTNIREIEAAIDLESPVAIGALRRSWQQLADADEAVRRYETALRRETIKRRLGESTVIDVINIETRMFNALLNQISVQQAHANAIVNLGFELGRLVWSEHQSVHINLPLILGQRWSLPAP